MDEFQQMASEGFKLYLRQARSTGLSLILANQSEADLMTKQASRLLDTIRANTQLKIYLSVSDPNTVKLLEKASGVIAYEREDGALDYRPRLTVNDVTRYSSANDLAICWMTRDSGFSAYGGNWFGIRTYHHITRAEFEKRDRASWPEATEATIVAERNVEGASVFVQGHGQPHAPAPITASDAEQNPLRTIPNDSKWALRLNEIYARRNQIGAKDEA
jgi:hypothetical protein